MYPAFIYISFSFLAAASVYLLVKNRFQYIVYSLAIFLVMLQTAGAFFKILHLPGGDELFLSGFAGTILGGVLMVWKSLRNKTHQVLFNKLAAGILLLVHIALFLFPSAQAIALGPLIYYPVTALVATVLINDQAEHTGEKNMLILFLLQGLFQIVFNLLKVL